MDLALLKEKHLLVTVHQYNSFTKDHVDAVAPYFKQVFVLVRYVPFAEISSFLPITRLRTYRKQYCMQRFNTPKNVTIVPVPVWYAPGRKEYFRLGERHYQSAKKIINRHRIRFDLIHSHFTWSSGYVGKRLKEEFSVPFVITAHGYDIDQLPFVDTKWQQAITNVLNAADINTTVSQRNIFFFDRLSITHNLRVIPNGYNTDLFPSRDQKKTREALNLPVDLSILLTVGNLVKVKNHDILIRAVAELKKRNKSLICFIIGGGPQRRELKRLIADLNLEKEVHLIGPIPHNEVFQWMNACDLFVLASQKESFGVVQIEALACGKPIVATKNGGSEEIISSDELGFLVPPGSVKQLADKISVALEKKWNSNVIRSHAEKYSWDNIAGKMLNVYCSLF